MSVLWVMDARGAMDRLKTIQTALDNEPEPPALSWSLFEDGSQDRGRLSLLFQTMGEAERMAGQGLFQHEALAVRIAPLPEEDWVALSLQGLPLVRAGRFAVYGAHAAGDAPEDAIGLEIEAGPAFGTGHHATTRGCLEAADELETEGFSPEQTLDLGTGSGLLAIAAARLWPHADILATDIDPESVEETRVNALKNAVLDHIEAVEADGFSHPVFEGRRFDLIFANILAGPLITLAGDIASRLNADGRVILSGLLDEQAGKVSAAYREAGLKPAGSRSLDGWTILVFSA
ncbi:50S ribosomal protein L11 methyltransferase [Alkalicaulis satelles]|uniref:Ribosomal protein L11 methyltransferase n=1 Tax=Alkalicaulis satelles TaxID=2609175 RepID=A0A5M6ZJ05_9PROT|nr:50S ribosomal protein L11 methyltransferase [Alkalicaulis satelles]KAA5804796.1 50S ribosomal protein L11 methyltransferase [Alkalicaulis satelles]